MAAKLKFVENKDELIDSTIEFFSKPEYYKEILRSFPKYFVHFKQKNTHVFGLSKFCACQNISVEEYLSIYRYQTHGGVTQKHISRLTKQKWTKRNNVDSSIKAAFDKWIGNFFPNYSVDNASFISLNSINVKTQRRKSISLNNLLKSLKRQEEIGRVGEEIACKYEITRLKQTGSKDSSFIVDLVSKVNTAAGYDIYSSSNDGTRYIEVKSSVNAVKDFYITQNEIQILSDLGKEAFLYFVHISNLKHKVGKVYKVCQNPIVTLKNVLMLKPILYKAQIKTSAKM